MDASAKPAAATAAQPEAQAHPEGGTLATAGGLAGMWVRHWRVWSAAVGVAFAVASYVVGTWIYAWELDRLVGVQPQGDPLGLLAQIPSRHPLTFFPWVAGTTALALVLGYLFNHQAKLAQRLEALAVTDGLTLVYNHRYFIQQLALEIKRVQRANHNIFALLLLDLDDFKKFNDTHGHLAGDDCLRLVAQAIRSSLRETDLVARYGGEEFVVIAPRADTRHGAVLAERIRRRVQEEAPITVSVGVAAFPDHGQSVDELIHAADMAMYTAKGKGKNQVNVAALPQGSRQYTAEPGAGLPTASPTQAHEPGPNGGSP